MTADLFCGRLVRLCAVNREEDAKAWARWNTDSEFVRNWDLRPAWLPPTSQLQEWIVEGGNDAGNFAIHTIEGDRMIGLVGLDGFDWLSRTAWVGIGIGETEFQGKGYGTDAMKVVLRYGFTELNLNRVNLTVFEYNQRAIRCYEKCGFKHEGIQREFIFKENKRWGLVNMGILRSDWEAAKP